MADPDMLNGRTVLVVEDEFLIALDIQRMLEEHSAGQLLFARTPEEAYELEPHWSSLNLAIVEVRAVAPHSLALARRLLDAGIAVVLSTANGAMRQGHPDLPGIPVVTKPISERDLAEAIGQALSNR